MSKLQAPHWMVCVLAVAALFVGVCGCAKNDHILFTYPHDSEVGRPAYVLNGTAIVRAVRTKLVFWGSAKKRDYVLHSGISADWDEFRLVISPDGRRMLLKRNPSEASTRQFKHGEFSLVELDVKTLETRNIPGMLSRPQSAIYSSSGKTIAIMGKSQSLSYILTVVDSKTGRVLKRWTAGKFAVRLVGWSSDSQIIYFISSTSGQASLLAFSLKKEKPESVVAGLPSSTSSYGASLDSKSCRLAIGVSPNSIRLVELPSVRSSLLKSLGDGIPSPMLFAPSGETIATGYGFGESGETGVQIIDLRSRERDNIEVDRNPQKSLPFIELLQWHPTGKDVLIRKVYSDRVEVGLFPASHVLHTP